MTLNRGRNWALLRKKLGFLKLTLNRGRNWAFLGSITVLGSTHVVEQLSFSMFLSILTFDFDLILGSFLTFWGPNGLFLGLG